MKQKKHVPLWGILAVFALLPSCNTLEIDPVQITLSFISNATNTVGSMDPISLTESDVISLPTNQFFRANWDFAGWATSSNGSVVYMDGASFTAGSQDVFLYAQWALQTYTLTFQGNNNTGGQTPAASDYNALSVVSVPGNVSNLLRINDSGVSYLFVGWNTRPDGSGSSYTNGASLTMVSNITLYAKWSPYQVGDIGPAGGMIFYDQGSYVNGWRYMEVELSNLADSVWGSAGTNFAINTSTNVGTGLSNTLLIVAQDPHPDKAADRCYNYSKVSGGVTYDDWFLPSLGDLLVMYDNLQSPALLDFVVLTTPFKHWSSSKYDNAWTAWFFNFAGTGGFNNDQKDWLALVRPARQF